MKTDELREKYLAFYETKGHARRPSDVLVPTWDPSVLFTPAGMNQFKDHFLGKVKLEFARAATCQKCLRTGDIDNVGRTAYHHTFFEMLGNFSFGDYFKRDAINWAWEFLTDKKWLGIDPARLNVSVYEDDDEAAAIWAEDVGLPSSRIERMGEGDNFWPANAPSQGPDGVCGPCSEVFFHPDHGEEVEIWNLVFTQFNRVGDPPNNLHPLPSKNIDTGMGLERTAAVLQGVETNFHIDILLPIVKAAAEVCGIKYEYETDNGRRLRRITDHVRACTFAIHENVYPGANKEKYVIKRLLRRAVLDGHQIGMHDPFLYKLVPAVADVMKTPYPELSETVTRVSGVIEKEEANFFATVDAGLERIGRVFDDMRGENRVRVDGGVAAELYQTHGVPPELFESLAIEQKLAFDWDAYHRAMTAHGEVSGKVQHTVMGSKGPLDSLKEALRLTEFFGYEQTETRSTVKGIVVGQSPNDRSVDEVKSGCDETIRVVLDQTPFYGESGGQVGDRGTLVVDDCEFEVLDTQKDGDLVVHLGRLIQGTLREGDIVSAQVDTANRDAIRRAHSATHILHFALQKNLGTHAQQQGSKVDRDWLRFDFTNPQPVAAEQLQAVESDVTARVVAAETICWQTLPLAEAREAGAMMLFGEKYPDPVRMVSMGDFSKELCGGTHLTSTADVDVFEIISEEGVAAGTRRIVALTGTRAREYAEQVRVVLESAARDLAVDPLAVPAAVLNLSRRVRDLKKQVSTGSTEKVESAAAVAPADAVETAGHARIKVALREAARVLNVPMFDVAERVEALQNEAAKLAAEIQKMAVAGDISADALLEKSETIAGATVVVSDLAGGNSNLMRKLIDQIRKKAAPCAVLLAAAQGTDKVTLVAGVSRDLVDRGVNAGQWVREVAPVVGGGGGGKPDMAQAGGKTPAKVPDALVKAREVIAGQLGG
jgi:alanyl-tRNA synthetase